MSNTWYFGVAEKKRRVV